MTSARKTYRQLAFKTMTSLSSFQLPFTLPLTKIPPMTFSSYQQDAHRMMTRSSTSEELTITSTAMVPAVTATATLQNKQTRLFILPLESCGASSQANPLLGVLQLTISALVVRALLLVCILKPNEKPSWFSSTRSSTSASDTPIWSEGAEWLSKVPLSRRRVVRRWRRFLGCICWLEL